MKNVTTLTAVLIVIFTLACTPVKNRCDESSIVQLVKTEWQKSFGEDELKRFSIIHIETMSEDSTMWEVHAMEDTDKESKELEELAKRTDSTKTVFILIHGGGLSAKVSKKDCKVIEIYKQK